jgi:RNA methyltransferase, TrmH family
MTANSITYNSLSKNKIKFIQSLLLKKNRDEQHLFVAEGSKIITELLSTLDCKTLVAEREWLQNNTFKATEIIEASREELKKISQLKTPPPVIAVFSKPEFEFNKASLSTLCLALDDVQDPGNVGTIIRIADWFGIETIFCSEGTADIFNPKTIQATMGAIARVKPIFVNLSEFLSTLPKELPIYGSFLNGKSIYKEETLPNGIVIMGNEGQGISAAVEALITKRLFIPNFPNDRATSESLNVATATAIICSEFRRRL